MAEKIIRDPVHDVIAFRTDRPPEALLDLNNAILTPHIAGWSPEAMGASVRRVLANAEGHFSGRGAVSVVG